MGVAVGVGAVGVVMKAGMPEPERKTGGVEVDVDVVRGVVVVRLAGGGRVSTLNSTSQ